MSAAGDAAKRREETFEDGFESHGVTHRIQAMPVDGEKWCALIAVDSPSNGGMLHPDEAQRLGEWLIEAANRKRRTADGDAVERCPVCRHAPHDAAGFCPNLASDNDCGCQGIGPVGEWCPDGGKCHHGCSTGCWRVTTCGPLSGVFPGNRWPAEVAADHAESDGGL